MGCWNSGWGRPCRRTRRAKRGSSRPSGRWSAKARWSRTRCSTPTPLRPGLAMRASSHSRAGRVQRLSIRARSRASSTVRSRVTAPRSMMVRIGLVVGMPVRRTTGMSLTVWWTTTPSRRRALRPLGATISTGASPRHSCQMRPAARCDAAAPLPTLNTAANTCCSHVTGAPATRSTRGCTGMSLRLSRHRSTVDEGTPSRRSWSNVTSPCWAEATRSRSTADPPSAL